MVALDDGRGARPTDVGVLSRDRRGGAEVVRFAYTDAWLRARDAFPLGPDLPLYPGDIFARDKRGVFGVLRDTSPDRWGRVLMERREALDAREQGRKTRRLGEWDFLLGVSDATRMGALRLRELAGEERYLDDHALGAPPATRLRELQAIALALDDPGSEDRPEYDRWLRQLLAPGTSLGGARPKATFAAPDGTLWIAKFPGRQDRYDVGAWEYLAHQLALRAGIRVPEAAPLKLAGEHHAFTVRRFDREGARRRLYASAMTLLDRDDGETASYLDVAQALQDHGDPETLSRDLAELYRRVVFNVLVGNRDDHLRNHGFLRGAGGWRLAPAFDVNPNPDKDEHALALDASTMIPDVGAVHATCTLYRLSSAAATRIENKARRAFDDWQATARSTGIPRREVQRLASVIDPGR